MSASSSSSHRLKTPTLSGLHTPNSIPTPHSPLPTFPLRSCEASRYAASALANLAGFPPAAQLIAEGEGRGLSKLVGLLSSGVDEILHPSVHAVAVLTAQIQMVAALQARLEHALHDAPDGRSQSSAGLASPHSFLGERTYM